LETRKSDYGREPSRGRGHAVRWSGNRIDQKPKQSFRKKVNPGISPHSQKKIQPTAPSSPKRNV
jgi:hypothetical protein